MKNSPILFLAMVLMALLVTGLFCFLQFIHIIQWNWKWLISPLWIVMGGNSLILLGIGFYTKYKTKNIKHHDKN
jgi:hypothetical protein